MHILRESYYIAKYKSLKVLENDLYFMFSGPKGDRNVKKNKNVVIDNTNNNFIRVKSKNKQFLNLYYKTIKNAIFGVCFGFNKKMRIKGLGYSFELVDKKLYINLGLSHKVCLNIPENVEVVIKKRRRIFVTGDSIEKVTCFCALIRSFKVPDNYKGKGILMQKEKVMLKQGKRV